MRLASRAKLSPFDFLALLPAVADLVGDVVVVVSDKRVTPEEIAIIGADLVAIVQSVVGRKGPT